MSKKPLSTICLLVVLMLMPTVLACGQSSRTYIRGPRGGCYYINGNGNKTYVDHSYCEGSGTTKSDARPLSSSRAPSRGSRGSSGGRTYIRGPRGGCYYINSSGNKTYVDRSLCN